jgi:hypothetical protein
MHFVALYLNEQHKDGYAILRGGVKEPEPLAVEPTEDAAIEKARKLDPDAAIHVERVRNVEEGGQQVKICRRQKNNPISCAIQNSLYKMQA